MINFFRTIRRNLMENNKQARYLKYAIGEIALVMIGILLALQVSNWNEDRKQKKEEIKMLHALAASLKKDIGGLDWHIRQFGITKASMDFLLDHMEDDLPYQDSLKYDFGALTKTWDVNISTDVFETLKAANINLISNDSLKQEILAYYSFAEMQFEDFISRYVSMIEYNFRHVFSTRFTSYSDANLEEISQDYLYDRVEDWSDKFRGEMVPLDYEALKQDREFRYHLKGLRNLHFWYIEMNLKRARLYAFRLIEHIEAELESS